MDKQKLGLLTTMAAAAGVAGIDDAESVLYPRKKQRGRIISQPRRKQVSQPTQNTVGLAFRARRKSYWKMRKVGHVWEE